MGNKTGYPLNKPILLKSRAMKKLLLILLTGIFSTFFADIQASPKKQTAIYDQPAITIALEQSVHDELGLFNTGVSGQIIYYMKADGIFLYAFKSDYFFGSKRYKRRNKPVQLKLFAAEKEYLQKIYTNHIKGMGYADSLGVFSIVVCSELN